MDTKFCRDCQRDLRTKAFTRNRANKDGLAFYCAECARSRHTASRRARLGPPKTRNGQGPSEIPGGSKWCPRCDVVLPLDQFPAAPCQANKVGAYCKPCYNRLIEENREKNHGSVRNYRFKLRYGITEAEVDAMFAEQNGACGICKEAPAAHVDHDHATGRVRGLLCFNCNQALGNFRDRGDLMLLAIHYLERGAAATNQRPPGATVAFSFGFDDVAPPGEAA